MRCGIVDMGSNSIRLSIYDCLESGEIIPVIHKKIMAGLAGYVKKGRLTERGIEKACSALDEFQALLDSFTPDYTGIFATASLRNISNQDEVVNSIRKTTGILPEIISGQEEARLDFLGATHFYPMERGLLADIGGGSTEFVWFVKNGPKEMISVPVGSLCLHTRWVQGLIPNPKEIEKMRREVRQTLDNIDWAVEPKDCRLACGIGGTMRMALQLSQELLDHDRQDRTFTIQEVEKLWKIATNDDASVSKTAYRILPERMFSMVPGLLLILEIGRRFGTEDFYVSQTGVREGYLIDRFLDRRQDRLE
ncbi:MAG: phosphatase [Candidatus Merdivicinus sp.]|jgi:exopolyphosphatase/guanosine-5'-triphosphate,3'-diphosphate pyrophosphatase